MKFFALVLMGMMAFADPVVDEHMDEMQELQEDYSDIKCLAVLTQHENEPDLMDERQTKRLEKCQAIAAKIKEIDNRLEKDGVFQHSEL